MSAKPSGRLNLPEALNGRFTGLTVATYGAEFAFLERFLLPRMPRQITNRVFLVDAGQFHKAITLSQGFRRLNRTYATAPIHAARSFHPKFLLLTGPESGRLLIGSGNASLSGYTGAGEAFTQYDWNPDHTEDLGAFTTVRDFLRDLHKGLAVDDLAWRLIEDQLTSAEWLTGKTDTTPIVHNLHEPIVNQFAQHIGSQPVTDVIAYAPFHDHGARAMKTLIRQLKPQRFTLLVQPRQTTLDIPALTTVTRPLGDAFTVKEIKAPEPYANAFLHAKFILAHTAHTDYLLQGSPNLSAVALCEDSEHGNVEMANVLSGPKGAFDEFLNTMTTTPLPNGLRDVTPAEWSDDNSTGDSVTMLRNITWEAPDLSGIIRRITEGSGIRVYVNAQQLTPAAIVVTTEGDSTHFTMTFGPTEIESLNQAERIDIQIHNEPPMPAYPYRVHELLRLSSTGHRIDLLREAGSLELDDKEIVEILQELDRIMIVDGRSLWRLAHPNDPLNNQEDDDPNATPIRYEDIDWSIIEAHPVYKGYSTEGAKHPAASVTELAILLDSLAGRFRIDAGQTETPQPQPAGDLGSEPELEDAEALDDAYADDEDVEPKGQSASTRAKRLWRSFVQRYIRGLSDHNFVEQVGPGVVIPSYVAFNHLCRRLRITEQIDPDYLTSAQIQLWTFMWGSPETPGYLASLPAPERQVALDVMNQHEDIPATLSAIDDTYWHAWNQGEDIHPLRDTTRTFLTNTEWHIDQAGLQQAATATSALSINSAEALLDEIWELAAYVADEDIDRELAASANLKFTDLRWKRETILRNGSPQEHHVLHLPDDYQLTAQNAAALLTTWANLDPDKDHYRAVAGRTIAIRDNKEVEALLFNRDTGEETQVNLRAADPPPWLQRINDLNSLFAA